MSLRKMVVALTLGAAALVAQATPAHAQVACNTLPGPIYVAGSSAVGPFIQAMGTAFAKEANVTTTLVYQSAGSCTGVGAIVNDTTPMGACAMGACITGNATYYDNMGKAQTCTLDVSGTHVDVGVSDVFVKTCTGMDAPATVADVLGPVQPMVFVAPKMSAATALTAEEGYFVFGFGAAGMVTPWVDETQLFIRDPKSGTQNIIANSIHVLPVTKMKGVDAKGSSGVLQGVSTAMSLDKAIGILSAGYYDAHRDVLKALAFRAFGQYLAHFPDSTLTAVDKRNVRDGHYIPFGYLHLDYVTSGGAAVRPNAKKFVDWVMGDAAGPFGNVLDVQVAASTIPQCAMKVRRTAEGGDLAWTPAAKPCNCYFEQAAKVAGVSCKSCTKDADCTGAGMQCNNGLCESTN